MSRRVRPGAPWLADFLVAGVAGVAALVGGNLRAVAFVAALLAACAPPSQHPFVPQTAWRLGVGLHVQVRLIGSEVKEDPDKQARCDREVVRHGAVVDNHSWLNAVLDLGATGSHRIVVDRIHGGGRFLDALLPRDSVEDLCETALKALVRLYRADMNATSVDLDIQGDTSFLNDAPATTPAKKPPPAPPVAPPGPALATPQAQPEKPPAPVAAAAKPAAPAAAPRPPAPEPAKLPEPPRAQPPEPPTDAAGRLDRRAQRLLDDGQYKAAAAEWCAAYDLRADPRFLYRIGHALLLAGSEAADLADLKRAKYFLVRYQTGAPPSQSADLAGELASLENEIATLSTER